MKTLDAILLSLGVFSAWAAVLLILDFIIGLASQAVYHNGRDST